MTRNVLLSVAKQHGKQCGRLTRRFIATEGVYKKEGAVID